jgi:hypothetical protein
MTSEENIFFLIDDSENKNENEEIFNPDNLIFDMDTEEDFLDDDSENQRLLHIINYNMNYTVKELLTICDYYEITKKEKLSKTNKEQIIHALVSFEINPINESIVCKRRNMWFYMNELKTDKFMKKYIILWN